MHVCVCDLYTCVYPCVCMCVCVCVCVSVWACMHVCVSLCVRVCMYMHACLCDFHTCWCILQCANLSDEYITIIPTFSKLLNSTYCILKFYFYILTFSKLLTIYHFNILSCTSSRDCLWRFKEAMQRLFWEPLPLAPSTDYFLFMYTYYLLASTCMCAPYVLLLLSLIS